jgi:hypothetical protein
VIPNCKAPKTLSKQWRRAALRDIEALTVQELARIDLLERTYWQVWEASKGEHSARTQVTKAGAGKDGRLKPQQLTVRTDETVGDPRFLQGVQRCIELLCAILGLDAS